VLACAALAAFVLAGVDGCTGWDGGDAGAAWTGRLWVATGATVAGAAGATVAGAAGAEAT